MSDNEETPLAAGDVAVEIGVDEPQDDAGLAFVDVTATVAVGDAEAGFAGPAKSGGPSGGRRGNTGGSNAGNNSGGGGGGGGGGWLQKRGYGWMLELEAEDEEDSDEGKSLMEELDINPMNILYKIRCVLVPFRFDRSVILTEPDFWGPFFVVLLYSFLSLWGNVAVVSWMLMVWLMGSFLIFILCRSLGGEVEYGQCLGVIGYSLLPVIVTSVFAAVISPLSIGIKGAGISWAAYSAASLLVTEELRARRFLIMYPLFLLYFYFVSLHSGA